MGQILPKISQLTSANYWLDLKKFVGFKNGTDMLYLHAKFGDHLPPYGRVQSFLSFICHAWA